MKYDADPSTLGGHATIREFVAAKLRRFEGMGKSFASLYTLMFSERDNTLFEWSEGYRIRTMTYGECAGLIDRKTTTLKALLPDVPAGAVVGIHMENSPEWIQLFWCILRCGWRPLLMNLRLEHAVLCDIIRREDVRAVVSDGADFPVPTVRAADVEPGDLCAADAPFGEEILFMSSGTSLHVKTCAYRADALYWQVSDSLAIITECPQMARHYHGRLKQLAFLPFYHVFGFFACYLWFSFFSRTFVFLADMAPQTVLNTIRRHEVTHIFCVPMLWNRVYAEAARAIAKRGGKTERKFDRGMRLMDRLAGIPALHALAARRLMREVRGSLFGDSVVFLISGGSGVGTDVLRFFNNIGYFLANGCGMTELGITSVELDRSSRVRCLGAVGAPFHSVEYRVEQGTLRVRGKTVACRIREDDAVRERGAEEWFDTADLAEQRGGRWYLLGRRDDTVIGPSGENLNPSLIEPSLKVKGARQVCLITDGRLPLLVVSVQPWVSGTQAGEIREKLAGKLREMRLNGEITRIHMTAEPLLGADDFKLNRAAVRRKLEDGALPELSLSADGPDAGDTPMARRIRELMAAELQKDPEQVGPATDFFTDLGGDSLSYLSLLTALEREFDVPLPQGDNDVRSTPKALQSYIEEQLK